MDAKKDESGRWEKLWLLLSAMAGSTGMPAVFGFVFETNMDWSVLGTGIVLLGSFWIPYLFMKKYQVAGVFIGILPLISAGILWREMLWKTIIDGLLCPMIFNVSRYLGGQEISRELLLDPAGMMNGMLFACGVFLMVCILIGTIRKLRVIVFLLYMIVFAFPFLNGLPICMEGVVCCGLAMIFLVMASPGASARPLAAAFIVALLFGILLPKQKMEEFFDDPSVWQERIEKLLQKTAVGGVTDGKLGTVDEIVDSGEEQLEIILSERPKQRVYLQGFVGMDYGDNEWTSSQNTDFLSSDDIHEVRKLEYETVKNNPNKVQYQSVKANIIRKGADRKYSYIPYKSNFTERMYGDAYVRGGKVSYSVDVLLVENVGSMGANPENVTYEETDKMALYLEFVNERYLQVPEKFYDQWIEEISGMQDRTLRALVKNIADYLEDKAEYSKSPGKTPSGEDFVSYFLEKSKKGYCVHFASAGVLFLRMKGIPARFVSGYVAKPSDFHETQDGTYKAVLDDSAAHAWAEIYVKGCGWLPAEMTPGYRNDDDPLLNTQHNTQQEVSGQETQQTPEQDLTENEELPKTENIQGKEQETKEKENDVEAEKDKVHGIIIVLRNVIFAVAVLIVTVVIIWKRKWRMIRLQKSGKKRYLQTFSLMREMMEVDLGKEIPEEAGMIMQTLKEEYGIVSERAQNVVRHAMETTYGNRKMRKGDVARMKKLALTVRSRIKKKRKGIRNFIFFFRKGF